MQLLYVVFAKSSDKLLHYLILRAEFIEVKMETLKTHEFRPRRKFITLSCDRRDKVFTVLDVHYFEPYQM